MYYIIGKVRIKSDFFKVPGRHFVDIICLMKFVELHPLLSRLNLQGCFWSFLLDTCVSPDKATTGVIKIMPVLWPGNNLSIHLDHPNPQYGKVLVGGFNPFKKIWVKLDYSPGRCEDTKCLIPSAAAVFLLRYFWTMTPAGWRLMFKPPSACAVSSKIFSENLWKGNA